MVKVKKLSKLMLTLRHESNNSVNIAVKLVLLLKLLWYYGEYTIETDNALRMQIGIAWALGHYNNSNLDWAPLLSAFYAIIYSITQKYFLYFDLALVLSLPFIEYLIFGRTVLLLIPKTFQNLSLISILVYTGYSFKYQINDVLVVYFYFMVLNALLEKKFIKAALITILVPILKYSAITIVFIPLAYYIYSSWKKPDYRNITVVSLILAFNISFFLLLTSLSQMDDSVTQLNFNQLWFAYKLDAFWLKFGVYEYLIKIMLNKFSLFSGLIIDIKLSMLILSLIIILIIIFSLVKSKSIRLTPFLFLLLTTTLLHAAYMLLLLVVVPPSPFPSSWSIGENNHQRSLLEIPRYFSFLNAFWFVAVLKYLIDKCQFIFYRLPLFLFIGLILSLNYSGFLFSFYNNIYTNNYKKVNIPISVDESNSFGERNFEAWKVYYITNRKDPNERF